MVRPGVMGSVLLLAACGSEPPPAPVPEAVPVTLMTVGPREGAGALEVVGTVRLKRETPLAFTSAGQVRGITVREGDRVAAGALLATLDTGPLDAAAAAAAADAARAAADLKRAQRLVAQGWVSQARVESAQAAARSSEAALSAARFNQRNGRIVAPTAGIILRRAAEPGQALAAGTPVLVLGEFASGYVVRLPLSESQMAGVRMGQAARVTLESRPAPLTGVVSEIAGRADERSGTFMVEVRLPADAALRSGMVGRATLMTGGGDGPLLLPATAVFAARAEEGFVWRDEGGVVRARRVALGPVRSEGVVVTAGLAPGDRIVRTGIDRLSEGAKVRPVPAR
ncbi:efflux RND transporter periplasmic adaptor subunit [Sandaracinobacteroides saxicola]|uniref:Efflux RND transporter periplasmic adaptor subunit n=1 Tax=Sandaracinobacteroides saxicola TaxID=2759707 RepID=A0A7G5IJX5_9SPHN|nr:efflux RND transporter periplasmic adaptor subunit [Sandaracinobacteroides saxicola]QMW23667.1 efflux RND transporter periplasmic adaptor subunit [Sandaracinobacteroides saxicola]